MFNILISGCGNIGLRHFQGIINNIKKKKNYLFLLHDPNKEAFKKFKKEINEHKIKNYFFSTDINFTHKVIDVVILCNYAEQRYLSIKKLTKSYKIKHFIIEKVLANTTLALNKINKALINHPSAWVNTPRRSMKIFFYIKKILKGSKIIAIQVKGGSWGLACNAIHFIDLTSWLVDDLKFSISTKHLNKSWIKSKRKNYYDINGRLVINFKNKVQLDLLSQKNNKPLSIKIITDTNSLYINENTGKLLYKKQIKQFKVNYQSDMTGNVVNNLIRKNTSFITSLNDSCTLHRPLIKKLSEHWKKYGNKKIKNLPIT